MKCKCNLVPRVSLLPVPGKKRDPRNEVGVSIYHAHRFDTERYVPVVL